MELYLGYMGIVEDRMETTGITKWGLYRGIGIMENNLETSIMAYIGSRV